MINIIVFSYNRAMQLNTLLSSIKQYWANIDYSTTVIYNYSEEFKSGYEILKKKYPGIHFIKEDSQSPNYTFRELCSSFNLKRYMKYDYIRHPKSSFRSVLIEHLSNTSADHVLFLTDDSKFISNVNLDMRVLQEIVNTPLHTQYALRLGMHINNPGKIERVRKNIITWTFDNPRNYKDWCYNFSVDAHIYDKNTILHLAKRIIFTNPNSYEAFTQIYCTKRNLFNRGFANESPCILSFPINMVQAVQDNESLRFSLQKLEQWFVEGFELDYPRPEQIDTFQQYPKHLILRKDGNEQEINIDTP